MLKTNKKKRARRTSTNLSKAALHLAVHTDSNLHLAPILRLDPSATFSVSNSTRGTHFIFGPVAGAAAVTALHLAQTQAQIALQQLASLSTITVGNQYHNNRFAAAVPPHLALLSLLNRQEVSAVGINCKTNRTTRHHTCLPAAMYHHHSQQQGPQPFSNGPRPHHQPHPNQHQNRTPSDMLSQVMGFQFPRPTQLPDELESALAIRGVRDMDHRLIDHMNPSNQHQNQGSGSGISQHGTYGSNPITLTSDSQPGHQQGIDWSSYQPPTKLFASPPPSGSHQSQRHQGPQQQPESSHMGTSIPNWTAPLSDSSSPQARHPGSGSGGDGQGLYTPESAGSILASFGLSNEDLEVLSHYPDDQLTPDTLPFILRDIQINKSGNQKTVASTSASSFSSSIHDMPLPPSRSSPLPRSHSPEVPSLLTVTQTAGKVIDYGHASRAKDENSTRETFKREPLSNERTVKMYPSSSSSASKAEKAERRQVHLEHTEPSKHGDRDYRRTSSDHRKSSRSPGRELPPSSKSRNLDRDYRHEGPKPRPSSETRSDDSSRRSISSSGSKTHRSSKKLPTPTMISDFSAASPKVYPHTCSLCHIQCDQEKDWVDHINTVNHTAACRDLRNKYPHWKPNPPSRSGQYGSRALWDLKDHSPSHSVSRSLSGSPTPGPPHSKHELGPHPHRPHGKLYSPHPRCHQYTEHSHRLEHRHSGSRSPSHAHRTSASSREHRPERRDRDSSGGPSRSSLKRPRDDSFKCSTDTSRHPSSSKMGLNKHGLSQSNTKTVRSGIKTGAKMPKTASAKATDTSVKPPLAKKKKRMVTPASQDSSVAERLVYLTGIPNDASEQEVTDLVGSFGKINNVILMPCSEEESKKGEGQKASVCMVKAEDAQALAKSTSLSIRDQQITASIAKKPEERQSSDANNSKPASGKEKAAAGEDSGGEADQKTSNEKGLVLITGLPEGSWSECDIIKLIQPFGTPSDIILAAQIGKVLVSVPDMEIAQEIVKVHTFIPAKINNSELKIIQVKQRIGHSTPVALYNLLMGSVDPLESPVPVGWSTLLVISNVPNTPSGSYEVQKLVRRFGTVIKTLVLNNTVICEMATAAMALSVYKRFQTFPCIIQNNPLFFSRKPDPKANTQTKVITAYLDSPEDTPANGKSSQVSAAADKEETLQKERSESALEGMENNTVGTDEKTTSTEKMVGEDEALGENEIKKDEFTGAAPDTKSEAGLDTDMRETPAKTIMETSDESKGVNASEAGIDKTSAGEETNLSSPLGKAASGEMLVPELPKVTQEMVNALLVECRTRTASHPNNNTNTATSSCGEKGETQMETEQGEKPAEETKEAKNHTEEEMKKQERERKEREARKEKEVRERERKERERRAWEKEERAKREREWEERARREREWERRERERRERKRAYGEGVSTSRSSCRSEGYKQSCWRDVHSNGSEVRMLEEDEEFPFNMSDFVTVDEVGDVTDLPRSPSPVVPQETIDGTQQDPPGDTPTEVATETTTSDATVTSVKSGEGVPECVSAAQTLVITAAAPSSSPATQADSSPRQTHEPTCHPAAPETETTPTAALDSTSEAEQLSPSAPAAAGSPPEAAPADTSLNSPATGEVTAESGEDKTEETALNHSKAKEEEVVQEQEDKQTGVPAAYTGKQERSEDQTNKQEESMKKKLQKKPPMGKEYSLPPFDPSNPVGMEFLVPKTGFFCKACNRFFSGAKEAEINHCRTAKHYENLQKYLQTTKTVNETINPESN